MVCDSLRRQRFLKVCTKRYSRRATCYWIRLGVELSPENREKLRGWLDGWSHRWFDQAIPNSQGTGPLIACHTECLVDSRGFRSPRITHSQGDDSMKSPLAIVLLVLSVTSAAVQDQPEPSAQYQELLKAYSTASRAFRAAETDLQRKQAVEQFDEYPQKFLDLADKYPADSVALLALRQAVQAVISVDSLAQQAWEMNREAFPVGSPSDSSSRIVALLLRDHLKSDQLAPICDRMRFGFRKEFEKFLSAALESNPHRNVQGMACLALAQLLRNQLYIADRVADRR